MNRYGAFSTNDPSPDMPYGQQGKIQPAGQVAVSSQGFVGKRLPMPIPRVTGPGVAAQGINIGNGCMMPCDVFVNLNREQRIALAGHVIPFLQCNPVESAASADYWRIQMAQWMAQVMQAVASYEQATIVCYSGQR